MVLPWMFTVIAIEVLLCYSKYLTPQVKILLPQVGVEQNGQLHPMITMINASRPGHWIDPAGISMKRLEP